MKNLLWIFVRTFYYVQYLNIIYILAHDIYIYIRFFISIFLLYLSTREYKKTKNAWQYAPTYGTIERNFGQISVGDSGVEFFSQYYARKNYENIIDVARKGDCCYVAVHL